MRHVNYEYATKSLHFKPVSKAQLDMLINRHGPDPSCLLLITIQLQIEWISRSRCGCECGCFEETRAQGVNTIVNKLAPLALNYC